MNALINIAGVIVVIGLVIVLVAHKNAPVEPNADVTQDKEMGDDEQ